MAGIKQDPNGKWKIDRGFLTPERAKIMQRLDKKHAAAKAPQQTNDVPVDHLPGRFHAPHEGATMTMPMWSPPTEDRAVPLVNTLRHAEALVEVLVDHGPLTSNECCERLGWAKGRFDTALRCAREELCPSLNLSIPHPTPAEGWRYQITDQWAPVEAGAAHALGSVETRLASIMRDVNIVYPQLVKGSREWRRASFLRKHLTHITSTLKEINNGEG